MVGKNVEHLHAFLLTMLRDLVPEHVFLSRLMGAFAENSVAAKLGLVNGPSGQHFGQFRKVFLGVSAVYAQGVQVHDLASVVFIQSAGTFLGLLLLALWPLSAEGPLEAARSHAMPLRAVR